MPIPWVSLRSYTPGGKRLTLAARISGDAKTSFPNGKPGAAPADDKKNGDKPAIAPTDTKPIRTTWQTEPLTPSSSPTSDLLARPVLGEPARLDGARGVVPTAHNAALVLSALENLSGSNALIALRGRGVNERPFTWVEELRRNAERQFREKEQSLEARLKTAQDELAKLQTSGASGVVLSQKEREAAEKFRAEMLDTRSELREVKRALSSRYRRTRRLAQVRQHRTCALVIAFGGLAWRRTWRRPPERRERKED